MLECARHLRYLFDSGALRTEYKMVEYACVRTLLGSDIKGRVGIDLGCAVGHQTQLLANDGAFMIGIDKNVEPLTYGKSLYRGRGYSAVVGDMLQLPIRSATVDFAVSFGVVEHIKEPARFLGSLRRVLKPSAKVVMTADSMGGPLASKLLLERFVQMFDVVNLYSCRELALLFTRAGYDVIDCKYLLSGKAALRNLVNYMDGAPEARPLMKLFGSIHILLDEVRYTRRETGQFVLLVARKAG
jgi:SAM-dependent methyltransferase